MDKGREALRDVILGGFSGNPRPTSGDYVEYLVWEAAWRAKLRYIHAIFVKVLPLLKEYVQPEATARTLSLVVGVPPGHLRATLSDYVVSAINPEAPLVVWVAPPQIKGDVIGHDTDGNPHYAYIYPKGCDEYDYTYYSLNPDRVGVIKRSEWNQ
jgi:hypothetical protein